MNICIQQIIVWNIVNEAYLDGKFPLREVRLPLLLFLGNDGVFVLGQPPPDGASLLGSKIEGQILLFRVEETELRSLVLVDDCEDAGDGFAKVVAAAGLPISDCPCNCSPIPPKCRRTSL